jgi:hypothetical protein
LHCIPMDHAAKTGCGARAVAGALGHFLGLHSHVRVSRLGFHGNSAVHGHTQSTAKVKPPYLPLPPASHAMRRFPPSRKDCLRRLAACLGHGAVECTTRRAQTGRVSGRRHSHGLALSGRRWCWLPLRCGVSVLACSVVDAFLRLLLKQFRADGVEAATARQTQGSAAGRRQQPDAIAQRINCRNFLPWSWPLFAITAGSRLPNYTSATLCAASSVSALRVFSRAVSLRNPAALLQH